VCRGWPPSAFYSAGESKLLGRRPLGTLRIAALSAGPRAPRAAFRFPPLRSPGHPSAAPHPLWAVWLLAPQEEDRSLGIRPL
jgi:hypothetical protein